MSGAAFSLYTLETPVKWQAGSIGEERTPFYFDCADCGADAPLIFGVIALADLQRPAGFEDIGILSGDDARRARPAMFCESCTAVRVAGRIGREVPA